MNHRRQGPSRTHRSAAWRGFSHGCEASQGGARPILCPKGHRYAWSRRRDVSIGVQKGPPIGVQKGPPSSSSVTGMTGAL
ncbi:MAG: hypothetical protein EKK50_01315, partial [Sphingomonadaceae bacterium]